MRWSRPKALRITEIAYRAGAATNIEVAQAQQDSRNGEIESGRGLAAAALDLLVALGPFP